MIVNFLTLGMPEIVSLFPILFWAVLFVFGFVKCVTNGQFNPTDRAVWVLVICIVPFFGAIAYLLAYGKEKKRETSRGY